MSIRDRFSGLNNSTAFNGPVIEDDDDIDVKGPVGPSSLPPQPIDDDDDPDMAVDQPTPVAAPIWTSPTVATSSLTKTDNEMLGGLQPKSLNTVSVQAMKLFKDYTGGKFADDASVYRLPLNANVERVEPIHIKDTEGRIGMVLAEISKRLELRIVPASLTNVPHWSDAKGYYSFSYKDETYYAPDNAEQVIAQHIQGAKECLSQGKIFVATVCKKNKHQGGVFLDMLLSPPEITHICSALEAYGPKIIDNGPNAEEPLSLVVGDYIV